MMPRKILLLMSLIFIFSVGTAAAADKTYEVPNGNCTVSLPENYVVTTVDRKADPNDELGISLTQLSVNDPADKTLTMHIMVESNKLTKELPSLDYKPGEVMKNYFTETLQDSGWQEPTVTGELPNGKMYFIKFGTYIADSAGQKYDGVIYATTKDGSLLYLMLMSKERALTPAEKAFLETTVQKLQFNEPAAIVSAQ